MICSSSPSTPIDRESPQVPTPLFIPDSSLDTTDNSVVLPTPKVSLDDFPFSFSYDLDSPGANDPEDVLLDSMLTTFKLRFLSQNVNKSNTTMHTILNDVLMYNDPIDVVLFQEPWFGYIGIDYECQSTETKNEKQGTVNNSGFIQFLPHPKEKPNVVCYIRKHYQGWNVTHRADIITHPSIMALQFSSGPHSMLVINLYNPADNSVAPLLSTLELPNMPTVITGDFNLHHLNWSSSDKQVMTSSSDALVSWMIAHNFTLQNRQGEITFFQKRDERIQTSVLDLTWMNTTATNLTENFSVR